MKTKTLLYLFVASLGLLALSISGEKKPHKTNIGDINASDIGEKIYTEGEVTDFYSSYDSKFLNVSDGTGQISVTSFSSQKNFAEGEKIRFSGQVTLYRGELEIIAEKFYTSR